MFLCTDYRISLSPPGHFENVNLQYALQTLPLISERINVLVVERTST